VNGIDRARALLADELRAAEVPTGGGYVDLLPPEGLPSTGLTQNLMLTRVVPEIYERWWRPALGRVAKGVFGPGMAEEKRIARLLLGLVPGDGVLDIACGTGNFTRDFARAVGPTGLVVGLDASTTMLARAVEDTGGMEQVAYVRGDAQNLPFRDHSFDAVCCFAALHLFADPMRALDSITRVLTPGGRVAIFTSCRGRSAPMRTWESLMESRSGMRMFEREDVVTALEERGFTQVRQRIAGVTQFVGGRLAEAPRLP
jgi:SAM-dependent methyltransferase